MFTTTNDTTQTAIEFIDKFFTEASTIERKSFKKFVAAMPEDCLTPEQIETSYTAFTGKKPRYVVWNALTGAECQQARNIGRAMLEIIKLNEIPISFSDAYLKVAQPVGWAHNVPNTGVPGALRRCFKDMAKAKAIDALEIKTCGRVAIRMYYLK